MLSSRSKEAAMTRWSEALLTALSLVVAIGAAVAGERQEDEGPASNLPAHIRRLTLFGERADWSHDGRRILFLEKTYGDAYEIDVDSGDLRLLTGFYPHAGYTRALYLSNGHVLLSGAPRFDPEEPGWSRTHAELSVLDPDSGQPPAPLGTKCSEGPAVSRRRLHIAWTIGHGQYPDRFPEGVSQIREADIVYDEGGPRIANERVVLDSRQLAFRCHLESQNFRPPDESELTFSTYDYNVSEAFVLDLETGAVRNLTNTVDLYEEPEGIFPDGSFTCIETDRDNGMEGAGHQYIDVWKLALDGSGQVERLTEFTRFPGFKASNPVVRDDGRFMAFQMAKVGDPAGVGRGIFLYDLERARTDH
jgi:Tol biopolymer transport system component